MKYVILDDGLFTNPIVFNEVIQHSAFLAMPGEIISAGFVSIDCENRNAKAYGESVSLGKKPGKDDDWLLTRLLFEP
jgi:hypothetical protein